MRGFTTEEKRQYVLDYLNQPYGTKATWLATTPVTANQMGNWRTAYLHGDLDRNLIPRDTRVMSKPARLQDLEKLLTKQQHDHEAALAGRDQEIASLRTTNDALGKAIGLMHKWSEHTPGDTPAPIEPKSS